MFAAILIAAAGCGRYGFDDYRFDAHRADGDGVAQSSITASPTDPIADGLATTIITITLADGSGNPIVGVMPEFTASGAGNTLVEPANVTDASGTTMGTLASTVAETKTLSIVLPAGLSRVTTSVTFAAPSYAGIILGDHPLAYWPLDEASGAMTARDESSVDFCAGAPCDGTYVGGCTLGVNGPITAENDTGVAFDGSTGYVTMPTIDVGDAFTIECWVRIASAGGLSTIVANSPSGIMTDGFRLFVNTYSTNDQTIHFETGDGTTGTPAVTAPGVFAFGEWNYVAAVVDRAAGSAHILYNGSDVTSTPTISTVFNTSAPLTFGDMNNPPFYFYLAGELAECALYGETLTARQIEAHYSAHVF
jgi:hypothetical protein